MAVAITKEDFILWKAFRPMAVWAVRSQQQAGLANWDQAEKGPSAPRGPPQKMERAFKRILLPGTMGENTVQGNQLIALTYELTLALEPH